MNLFFATIAAGRPWPRSKTLLGLGTGRKPTTYKQIRDAVDLSTRSTTPDPKLLRLAETTG